MKIKVKNLGILKQAEFELGDFTIICGQNNTGKTYATLALFGFLNIWKEIISINVDPEDIQTLLSEGVVEISIQDFVNDRQKAIKQVCKNYIQHLPNVFASSEKYFLDTDFLIELDPAETHSTDAFERTISTAKGQLLAITKEKGKNQLLVSLLTEKEKLKIPVEVVQRVISNALKEILFAPVFPNTFIASAERTGAAIFRNELNFARNHLLEKMNEKKIDPFELLEGAYSKYPMSVNMNVEFMRQLEDISKQESFISKHHPKVIDAFFNIIGGEYNVSKNGELYYVPQNKKTLRLTMGESSSAVRSLLDIGFYLRHIAKPGDLLIVDEPELNLHPENQRRIARLFVRLIKLGIKVFITTHSDYIIKELNTLIMLNQDKPHLKQIAKQEGYQQEELLSVDRIKVYVAEEALIMPEGNSRKGTYPTLTSTDIDPQLGIEVPSFDTAIDEMNRIQEAIFFSEEDA